MKGNLGIGNYDIVSCKERTGMFCFFLAEATILKVAA